MQEILVSQEESGQRFDKYLRRRLPLAPSSFIYKMLRKKNITLRGKKADGSEKVETGDSVKLFLSDETILKFSRPQDDADARREADEALAAYKTLQPLLGPEPVLYEDDNILAVRKPSGVLSQKAEASDLSMNEWLRGYLAQKNKAGIDSDGAQNADAGAVFRPSVCNRLDRNTGGILLCAKTLPGSRALSAVIRDRLIRKTYTMIVHGQVFEEGVIENQLIKDHERNQVRVADGSRAEPADSDREMSESETLHHAVTVYRPVKTGRKASMVEADLITGRSHQLRVHMASIGHPIVSDPRYGDRNLDQTLLRGMQKRQRGQLLWCSEVFFSNSLANSADADNIKEVLSPVAGRLFKCPPPRWWADLCDDTLCDEIRNQKGKTGTGGRRRKN